MTITSDLPMQQIIEGLLLVSPEVHTENIILAFNSGSQLSSQSCWLMVERARISCQSKLIECTTGFPVVGENPGDT
jgi:hypothetical protein